MNLVRIVQLTLYLLLLSGGQVYAIKTDRVWLNNGDVVTGEVKELKFGLLSYSTDDMGTVQIKWSRVKRIRSLQALEIFLKDGSSHFGSLDTTSLSDQLVIDLPDTNFVVGMEEVIALVQIKAGFFQRLSGGVNMGLSYNKASEVAQITLGSNILYRSFSWWSTLDGNVIVTDNQVSEETTSKADLTWGINRSLQAAWTIGAFGKLEQNSQLGLNARASIGLGGGKEFLHTNRVLLNSLMGFLTNRESLNDGTMSNNVEGFIGLNFKAYKYFFPKLSIDSSNNLYPSLTQSGRVRFQTDNRVSWEVFKDFTVGVTFYYNFDNQPSAGSSDTDYGLSATLGYSF